jgi:Restriction endonuclease
MRSTMANDEAKWKVYERMAAKLEEGFQNCSVVLNHKVIGRRSGVERQVDVWVTGMVGGHEAQVAVECRLYARKVGIKDVEAFHGFIDDVGADRGVIISPSGFTEGATRRAERIELKTLTFEEAEDFDWSAYWEQEWEDEHHRFYTCRSCGGDISWEKDQLTGKAGTCRSCGAFHVWCHRCNCVHPYELSTRDKHFFHTIRCEGKSGRGRCRATWTLYFERGLIEGMRP